MSASMSAATKRAHEAALTRDINEAREWLEASGYTVVKTASYLRARERQRIAEAQRDWEVQRRENVDRWACKAYDDNQQLRDRLTFVYGVARAHGASVDELSGLAPVSKQPNERPGQPGKNDGERAGLAGRVTLVRGSYSPSSPLVSEQPKPVDISGWMDTLHMLAVDALGYVWRAYPHGTITPDQDIWSMAPVNPDNSPIPGPVTYYAPVGAGWPYAVPICPNDGVLLLELLEKGAATCAACDVTWGLPIAVFEQPKEQQ